MQDNRLQVLRAIDAFSHDFTESSQCPVVATRDLGRLAALAKVVLDDIDGWGNRIEALDCAAPYDRARAVLLVMESVFDEALTPDACRVLSAEMDLLLKPTE